MSPRSERRSDPRPDRGPRRGGPSSSNRPGSRPSNRPGGRPPRFIDSRSRGNREEREGGERGAYDRERPGREGRPTEPRFAEKRSAEPRFPRPRFPGSRPEGSRPMGSGPAEFRPSGSRFPERRSPEGRFSADRSFEKRGGESFEKRGGDRREGDRRFPDRRGWEGRPSFDRRPRPTLVRGSQLRAETPRMAPSPRGAETETQGEATSFAGAAPSDLIWGRHSAHATLESGRPIHRIWCTPEMRFSPKFLQLLREAKASGVLVEEVTWARLGQLTGGAVHQGIVLQPAAAETLDLPSLIEGCRTIGESALLIALDGLTDPQNLGAIVRSAEALGAHGMVLPQRRSAGLTGSVAKVAAGALEHLPVARVVNLNRALDSLKQEGYRVVGLAAEGALSLEQADLEGPLVVVTGSESEGLSMLTRRSCDQVVRIPLRGATPSLNASVATALLLYEVARRGWMKGLDGSSPAPRLVRPALPTQPPVAVEERSEDEISEVELPEAELPAAAAATTTQLSPPAAELVSSPADEIWSSPEATAQEPSAPLVAPPDEPPLESETSWLLPSPEAAEEAEPLGSQPADLTFEADIRL